MAKTFHNTFFLLKPFSWEKIPQAQHKNWQRIIGAYLVKMVKLLLLRLPNLTHSLTINVQNFNINHLLVFYLQHTLKDCPISKIQYL